MAEWMSCHCALRRGFHGFRTHHSEAWKPPAQRTPAGHLKLPQPQSHGERVATGGPFLCHSSDMRVTADGHVVRTDIWREGAYLDLWSVPHFLSGMVVAFSLYFLGFEARSAFIIAFLLLVVYELFESVAKIEETKWNRVLDVVVGMASFSPTFLLVPRIDATYVLVAFGAIALADAILSFFGWRASQKAAELEKVLRAQLHRERERFARRQKAIASWRSRRNHHKIMR